MKNYRKPELQFVYVQDVITTSGDIIDLEDTPEG